MQIVRVSCNQIWFDTQNAKCGFVLYDVISRNPYWLWIILICLSCFFIYLIDLLIYTNR